MSTDFYFFTARANGCDIYLFNKNIYALTAQRCSKYNKVNINYIHFLNKKKKKYGHFSHLKTGSKFSNVGKS